MPWVHRVHRALAPKGQDGPPRDIVAKFHFYRSKELLLNAARHKEVLHFQGHNYQLFADLSKTTISKRCALKPLLQILQHNAIIYQWGFPFFVLFTHQNHKYTCRNAKELQSTLQNMGLMKATKDNADTRQRSAPSPKNISLALRENENRSKLSPVLDQSDSMDWFELSISLNPFNESLLDKLGLALVL